MISLRKFALAALPAAALSFGMMAPAGAVTQLGFILDDSGSIGAGNWSTITTGLATAVGSLIPTDGSYEITVVKFSTAAQTVVGPTILTAGNVAAVVNAISTASFGGGSTNFAAAFSLMNSLLAPNIATATATYVNFATDGQDNVDTANTVPNRNALIAAGVDNISIEGIGSGVDSTFLQNSICHPGPCDTTVPFNFPAQGFYIAVPNAAGYASAIGTKIQTVIPEPMSLALFGMGLAGLGLVRRRRA